MNMNWTEIEAAVTRAVDARKIGTPRALRLTVHIASEDPAANQTVSALSDAAMSACEKWFGGAPGSESSAGDRENRRVLMAMWPNGAAAAVSVSRGGSRAGGDLSLLGTRGSIYHRLDGAAE